MTAMAWITHPDCLLHDVAGYNPEKPERLQVIEQQLRLTGLYDQLKHYPAPLATREQLLKVHDADYIDFIFQSIPKQGLFFIDPDTGLCPHSLNAILRAAGAGILGVDLILKNEVDMTFCNIRPPGHHAEKNKAMGFCFFNNIAVAAAHALEHFHLKRIAIVDFDAHHGNGTENIFYDDKRVLFCSAFQYPFYPFSGANTKSTHIVNIPLPAGTNGRTLREEISVLWLKQIREFKPEMLFVSAGFDGYREDMMSDWLLRDDDYAWLGQELKKIANECCQGRILSSLEGGYALNGLGQCVTAYIQALLED